MSSAVTAPRRAALEVLRAARSGDLADRALERVAGQLAAREHGWLQELVYGTFRLRGRLDHILAQRVKGGLRSLQPDVHDVLRLGLYQLLEMGSVPPYAAVSQSVELVRFAGAKRAAGLVNGVLNSIQRERDRLKFPELERDPVAHLTSWGSHPEWLVRRWLQIWSVEEVAALVEANNRRPELYLRMVGCTAEEGIERLAAAGIVASGVSFSPESVHVHAPANVAEALAVVSAVVQDPAASLVPQFAAVPEGARVLDLCAAPGGKAVALADMGAQVVAADLSLRRLSRLSENVKRLGMDDRLSIVQADARFAPFAATDAVLLDAPCTGTGTLRRHPDGRWRIDQTQLESLVVLQRDLLAAAAERVLPNGLLIYSTCSLEPEENEVQVREFLSRHPEFVNEPAPDSVATGLTSDEGFLTVLPQRHGVDGAFAARLRRSA